MKKFIVFVTIVWIANLSHAQNDYEVREQSLPYHKLASSFTIETIGVGEGLASHQWEKFVEKHKGKTYLTEYGEGTLHFVSEQVEFPYLNNQIVTIYSMFSPNASETGVLMTIWIQMKDGNYFSSKTDPEAGKKIKSWLLAFHNELMQLNRTH